MSMIKRLFGAARKPELEAPSQIDPPPDSKMSDIDTQAATRRELVRVMTRDTLRASGIPEGWIESQVILELGRGGQAVVHLRLVMKRWEARLLKYAVAFQNRLTDEVQRFDPDAREWLASITWQFQVGDTCPFPDLPDPPEWQAPVTRVDVPIDAAEADEVSEDLALLFAIRDANLPASGKP